MAARAALGCALTLAGATWSAADVIELKGGGELSGVLVEKKDSGEFVMRTADGATVAVARRDIARFAEEDPNLALYRERAKQTADTARAHLKLARWCHERQLFERRDHHYRRVLQLDPEQEEARQELGYRKVGGKWMTRDELLQSRGMKMYDGKYRTAQAIALREMQEERKRKDAEWFNQLRTWRDWMHSRREDRIAEGRARLASVVDPQAAPALAKLLQRETVIWIQEEMLATLGQLHHPATAQALVDVALYWEDDELARKALDYLTQLDVPRSIVPFVAALRSKKNEIVNRAAEALKVLGDAEAISPLIDALQTNHRYQVGSGGQMNVGFDGSGGGGFSTGGGPKIVQMTHRNVEVLNALAALSGGQDFGYDEQAWRRWFVNQRTQNQVDSRRDP